MTNYDELDTYNGIAEHDMWVDFDYYESTDELSDLYKNNDLDYYFNNLNDWD